MAGKFDKTINHQPAKRLIPSYPIQSQGSEKERSYSKAVKRPRWCKFIGERIEFNPTCQTGWRCQHRCQLYDQGDEHVIDFLNGNGLAVPAVDCQDCEKYSERPRHIPLPIAPSS